MIITACRLPCAYHYILCTALYCQSTKESTNVKLPISILLNILSDVVSMFSKLVYIVNKPAYHSTTRVVCRSFSESAKKTKTKDITKLTIFFGITIPTIYGTYKYASSPQARERADETVLIHLPWFMKKMHKWFPLDCYTPYSFQVCLIFYLHR